jgi:LAO/AO transport system kinase
VTGSPSARSSGDIRANESNKTAQTLAEQVIRGDRRGLARAITLVESTRADHRADAAALLDALLPATGQAMRVGISGAPGVGKSTFIEAFGVHLLEHGHRVAVLAVDPSSTRSGGSVLGDKTRMEALARHPDAYIRPSPSGGAVGGVARRTREAMLVCEAAGYDVVLVETVGVGQSETEVDDMVDVFVLLVAPGAGDELQGIKRGVMELADVVVVTKADGDLLGPARQAAADYRQALHLLRPKHRSWNADVVLCSAFEGEGIADVWRAVVALRQQLVETGELDARRSSQAKSWFWAEIRERLLAQLRDDPERAARIPELEEKVVAGAISPTAAAQALLA